MSARSRGIDAARRRLAALLAGTPLALRGAGVSAAPGPSPHAPQDRAAPEAHADADADADADAGADFTGRWVHAFAAYGAPKYGPDFTHFGYVNPDAPRGGTLKLRNPDRRSSFDKFNPWTTRGNAPAGVMIWMVEGLAHLAQDEPMTMYGLLAEAIRVAPDFSSVSFRIRAEARFSNGDAVGAEDVRHSFAMLSGKGASPGVQQLLAGIARVDVVDARTVRFEMRDKTREQVFVAGTMPVFSRKWGAGKPFDELVSEPPILSGPYVIEHYEMPRRIELRFDPQYWGRRLPVRRGHFNFERVVYRMYSDSAVAREAFKAGEYDLMKEYSSRAFVRQHAGVKWDDGRIVKAMLPTHFGYYMQSYQLNLRRPIFQDARVREALVYTYDFDTLNKTHIFRRCNSMFNNSPFAAQGLPAPAELALLEPFRAELPSRVFGPAWVAPSTGATPEGLRRNLLHARDLLDAAGWKLDAAGKLRNAKGEPFVFEYMQPSASSVVDWQRNLDKLGIEMRVRVVDFALYARRLDQYDFDMVAIVEGRFTLPQGTDLVAALGSKSADEPGNGNYRGVKSRAVDALIEAMIGARTLDALRNAARALDRVIMWSFWSIPDLYLPFETFSYWNKFGIPKTMAEYFQTDTLIGGFTEFGPWPLWTWWDKSLGARTPAAAGKG